MPERRIEIDGIWREPDKDLKLNSVQKHLISFARKHQGAFKMKDYERHLKNTVDDIKQREYLLIRKNNACRGLMNAGYLVEKRSGEYEMNPLVLKSFSEQTRKAAFSIKNNHRMLLMKNKNGIISKSELKREHSEKSEKERYRQNKFIDGMVRNLKENGYLESLGNGKYRLTPLGVDALSEDNKPEGSARNKKSFESSHGVRITAFDKVFMEVSDDGKLRPDLIDFHARRESIIKRIETLRNAGFIKDDTLTEAFIKRINLVKELSNKRSLSFDRLTPEQQLLLSDMRQFLNLYRGQITKYIYKGNAAQADMDIQFMVSKGLIKKDKLWDIFVLGDEGIKMTNTLFPDAVRYKTKVYSRREEVGHDALVYTTFKHFEGMASRKNFEILEVKTDRQLRSEDAKAFGSMQGAYPDLWVRYRDRITHEEFSEGLEVDIQYDERTIRGKVEKILLGLGGDGHSKNSQSSEGSDRSGSGNGNSKKQYDKQNSRKASDTVHSFDWYCNKATQVNKVIKVFRNIFSDPGSRHLSKAKQLNLFFIDEDGKVHKVKWR